MVSITGADLAKLAKYLPGIKFFAELTPTRLDDIVVSALERIAGDEELLDQLAAWLSWLPLGQWNEVAGTKEPELPECLLDMRHGLESWRTNLRAR